MSKKLILEYGPCKYITKHKQTQQQQHKTQQWTTIITNLFQNLYYAFY